MDGGPSGSASRVGVFQVDHSWCATRASSAQVGAVFLGIAAAAAQNSLIPDKIGKSAA
jgi:hypothetical protein